MSTIKINVLLHYVELQDVVNLQSSQWWNASTIQMKVQYCSTESTCALLTQDGTTSKLLLYNKNQFFLVELSRKIFCTDSLSLMGKTRKNGCKKLAFKLMLGLLFKTKLNFHLVLKLLWVNEALNYLAVKNKGSLLPALLFVGLNCLFWMKLLLL